MKVVVAGWWWVQQKTSAVSKLKLAGPVSPELGAMALVTWREKDFLEWQARTCEISNSLSLDVHSAFAIQVVRVAHKLLTRFAGFQIWVCDTGA